VQGELIGRSWLDVCVPERDRARARAVFEDLFAGRLQPETEAVENAVVTKDGVERDILWHNTVLRDRSGVVTATLSSGIDVTERRVAEDRIAHLAYHDALTDLPNRALLGEHLEMAIARARRSGRSVALLSIDLDDFKLVNDAVGHPAGDEVLLEGRRAPGGPPAGGRPAGPSRRRRVPAADRRRRRRPRGGRPGARPTA
jgi:PAS domain S-box-containing protein